MTILKPEEQLLHSIRTYAKELLAKGCYECQKLTWAQNRSNSLKENNSYILIKYYADCLLVIYNKLLSKTLLKIWRANVIFD